MTILPAAYLLLRDDAITTTGTRLAGGGGGGGGGGGFVITPGVCLGAPAGTLTPATACTPYVTPAQMAFYVDVRTLAQLAVDDNGVSLLGMSVAQLQAFVAASATLLELAAAASGELEVACVAGARYLPGDLANLVAAGGNGAAFLRRLTTGLAIASIAGRRVDLSKPYERLIAWAEAILQQLRSGVEVLPFLEAEAAGLPEAQPLTLRDKHRLGLYSVGRHGVLAWGRRSSTWD